jgi:hypothetical protein
MLKATVIGLALIATTPVMTQAQGRLTTGNDVFSLLR